MSIDQEEVKIETKGESTPRKNRNLVEKHNFTKLSECCQFVQNNSAFGQDLEEIIEQERTP